MTKKLAIMQPYIFPYIGYWHLISSVDLFVYYDDVSFRKQSWINRNYINLNGSKYLFTISTVGASSYKNINEVIVGQNLNKIKKLFCSAYSKYPYFQVCNDIINSIFLSEEKNLSTFIINSNQQVLDYLQISKKIYLSSTLDRDLSLRGQDAVLNICQLMGADTYINLPGGKDLYDRKAFEDQNISLEFIQEPTKLMESTRYSGHDFSLSIIDSLMKYPKHECLSMLSSYELHQF